jgi:thiamine biosynthesis lipoprotein
MGTTASVHVNDDIAPSSFDDAVREIQAELERLEQMFSVYRDTSEISRINRGELHLLDASPEVLDVMDACSWLEQISNGAFSIRPKPDSGFLNPSGFVKGWATERASRLWLERGLQHWYVGVGGDYVLFGGFDSETPWTIGIIDPRNPEMLVGNVEVVSGGIATSGTAERGQHLWNPKTGGLADSFLSITVTGPRLTWADAFATTVFVMGEPGLEWITQFEGYSVLPVR